MTTPDGNYNHESTLYVVSYDIPDDRRRTRVHSALTGFGTWVQYSVFECFLDRKQRMLLEARLLEEFINEKIPYVFMAYVRHVKRESKYLAGETRHVRIMSIFYNGQFFCEARGDGPVKHDASQDKINVSLSLQALVRACKGWDTHV